MTGTAFPLVSIIMPTYNRAAYIPDTIASIRDQTYKNWELIIVDDGSDDHTGVLVSEINDSRIQFHEAGRIGVVGTVRNLGLQRARGDMVAIIDSDDLWEKTKLEKQLKAFDQHPDSWFCQCGGYNFKTPGQPLEYFYIRREGSRYGNFFIEAFKSGIAATIQSLMFRRDCLDVIGLFEEKELTDARFMLRLAYHFNGIILYEPLFYRRLHEGNHSGLKWMEMHYHGLALINSYKSRLPIEVYQDAMFRSKIHFGERCLLNKKTVKGISQFLCAWKYRPMSVIPLKKIGKAILGK